MLWLTTTNVIILRLTSIAEVHFGKANRGEARRGRSSRAPLVKGGSRGVLLGAAGLLLGLLLSSSSPR